MLACRGEGRACIKLRIEGGKPGADFAIEALTPEGQSVPAQLLPLGEDSGFGLYLIRVPLFELSYLDLHISSLDARGKPEETSSLRLSFSLLKWISRFNYRTQREACKHIRDYRQPSGSTRLKIGGLRFLEGENCSVWRFFVEWEGKDDASLEIECLDSKGSPFGAKIIPFEEQALPAAAIVGGRYRRIVYSAKIGKEHEAFCIRAADLSGNYEPDFFHIDRGDFERHRHRSWQHMKDARADDANYRRWFALQRADEAKLREQREHEFAYAPLLSIVVPCFESCHKFLSEMLDSVLEQSYANWELLLLDASPESGILKNLVKGIKDERIRYFDLGGNEGIVGNTNRGIRNARGDFIAFLDHDDLLEPDALFEYVKAINAQPLVSLLFCDEDMFEKKGIYCQPVFKTRLNQDLLYSHNCVTHFLTVRASLLFEIGLCDGEVAGAQDFDLTLRALEAKAETCHIPRVLYHWREHAASTSGDNAQSKPYAQEAGRLALERHFERRGIAARVLPTDHIYVYRVHYQLPLPHPQLSIIIPNKDHIELLEACISSIIGNSSYDNYRIVVVENNSEKPETFAYYEQLQRERPCVSVLTWEGDFNYAKIINFGVRQTTSPYLLLLNNDTKVITGDFIEEMLGYLQRLEVGVVGAKLFFRDGLVQHAGMLIGPHGAVAHVNQDFATNREGYLARAVRPGNFSSLTGACQMLRRSTFEEVGGYNEDLAVGFNDVDFCLKLWKAGYRVVFSPYAHLYHYEFATRGRESADPEKLKRWEGERELFWQTWPQYLEEGDPFSNPNLDRDNSYYALPQL